MSREIRMHDPKKYKVTIKNNIFSMNNYDLKEIIYLEIKRGQLLFYRKWGSLLQKEKQKIYARARERGTEIDEFDFQEAAEWTFDVLLKYELSKIYNYKKYMTKEKELIFYYCFIYNSEDKNLYFEDKGDKTFSSLVEEKFYRMLKYYIRKGSGSVMPDYAFYYLTENKEYFICNPPD